MLNETTYPPVNFFYDVSAWSQPLIFNVSGGYSGAAVTPSAQLVAPLAEPAPPTLPADLPRIGVLQTSGSTAARESAGWLRWLFDRQWHVPFQNVTPAEIAAAVLTDVDVLVATNGNARVATLSLGKPGKDALRAWVNHGGQFVGIRGGTELAARLGLTTARLRAPHSDVPGSLFRVAINQTSPLADDVGNFDWTLYDYDDVMTIVDGTAPVRFPAFGSQDFFVSGFASGEDELPRLDAKHAEDPLERTLRPRSVGRECAQCGLGRTRGRRGGRDRRSQGAPRPELDPPQRPPARRRRDQGCDPRVHDELHGGQGDGESDLPDRESKRFRSRRAPLHRAALSQDLVDAGIAPVALRVP
jgi:hypothetical protein